VIWGILTLNCRNKEDKSEVPKISAIGSAMVQVIQNILKSKMSPLNHNVKRLVTVLQRSLMVLRQLKSELSFKSILTVEILYQKVIGFCVENSMFDVSLLLIQSVFSCLLEDKLIMSSDGTSLLDGLDILFSQCPKDEVTLKKLLPLLVFCFYTAARCKVEIGEYESALCICNLNFKKSLENLSEVDGAKAQAFARSAMALLFHHTAGILDKRNRPDDAFNFRKIALQIAMKHDAIGVDKENSSESALFDRILGASGHYLRSKYHKNCGNKLFRVENIVGFYKVCWEDLRLPSLQEINLKEFKSVKVKQISTFALHFASLACDLELDEISTSICLYCLKSAEKYYRVLFLLQLLLVNMDLVGDKIARFFKLSSDPLQAISKAIVLVHISNEAIGNSSDKILRLVEKFCSCKSVFDLNHAKALETILNSSVISEAVSGSINVVIASRRASEQFVLAGEISSGFWVIQRALELCGETTELVNKVLTFSYNTGVKFLQDDRIEEACRWLELAASTKLFASRAQVLQVLGSCLYREKRFEEARFNFLQLVEKDKGEDSQVQEVCACNLALARENVPPLFACIEAPSLFLDLLRLELEEFESMMKTCDNNVELLKELQDQLISTALLKETQTCSVHLESMRMYFKGEHRSEFSEMNGELIFEDVNEEALWRIWEAVISNELEDVVRYCGAIHSSNKRYIQDIEWIAEWLESNGQIVFSCQVLDALFQLNQDRNVQARLVLLTEKFLGDAQPLISFLSATGSSVLNQSQFSQYSEACEVVEPLEDAIDFMGAAEFSMQRGNLFLSMEYASKALLLLTNGCSNESSTWQRTRLLADCMMLVGSIQQHSGDPRSARYYYEQGLALATASQFPLLQQAFQLALMEMDVLSHKMDRVQEYPLSIAKYDIGVQINMSLKFILLEDMGDALQSALKGEKAVDDTVSFLKSFKLSVKNGPMRMSNYIHRANARFLLLQGISANRPGLLERSIEVSAAADLLLDKCSGYLALGKLKLTQEQPEAKLLFMKAFEQGRMFCNPEFNRMVFRNLGFCMTNRRQEFSYLVFASCSMSLSVQHVKQQSRCEPLHLTWENSLEIGAARQRELCENLLPSNWIVCGIVLTENPDILMFSRETGDGRQPICIAVPLVSQPKKMLQEFKQLMDNAKATTTGLTGDEVATWDKIQKRKWWDRRKELDMDLKQFMIDFEESWIGPMKILFCLKSGTSDRIIENEFFANIFSKYPDLQKEIVELFLENQLKLSEADLLGAFCMLHPFMETRDAVELLQHVVENEPAPDFTKLKVVDLKSRLAAEGLNVSGLKKDLIERLEVHFEKVACIEDSKIVLVLSEQLQALPIESMPCLRKRSVTRISSLPFAFDLLQKPAKKCQAGFKSRGSFIVDPRGDLSGTKAALTPAMEKLQSQYDWDGIDGSSNLAEQKSFLKHTLESKDLLLFCGHGSGEDLLSREKLATISKCSSALLMGCSSGKQEYQGVFEPTGIIPSYILSGSSAVVANLWDVTDKDIDKLTLALLDSWLFKGDVDLAEALHVSRNVCKLPYLVGAAPVYYGLPLKNNNEFSK